MLVNGIPSIFYQQLSGKMNKFHQVPWEWVCTAMDGAWWLRKQSAGALYICTKTG